MTASSKNATAPTRERRGGIGLRAFRSTLYRIARDAELPISVLLLALCFLLVLAVAK